MNLLLFGGNSLHNKTWIYDVAQTLSPLFDECTVHEYAHWQQHEGFIDFDRELAALQTEIAKLGTYTIFAKSVGSILALRGIYEGIVAPERCILVGVPLSLVTRERIPLSTWLRANKVPLLFIQNSHDPLGSYKEITSYITQFRTKPYATAELPGSDHSYTDLTQIKDCAQHFIAA